MITSEPKTIFLISDGTGETASVMTRAALVQYMDRDINIVRCKNVRRPAQVEALLDEAVEKKGFVVFTVVSPVLRERILNLALKKEVPAVDLLGPLLTNMDSYFGGQSIAPQAGLLRSVDDRYFKRIEAMEYTVKHDDGKELRDLEKADVVLVGISRTSKTPLSIFLSHKGWKVANIPLVLDVPPPEELKDLDQRRIVGLTIDPAKLAAIRAKRLEKLGEHSGEYASMETIAHEIEYAMGIFRQNRRWPIFDVTERALEETASEIIKVVSSRLGLKSEIII